MSFSDRADVYEQLSFCGDAVSGTSVIRVAFKSTFSPGLEPKPYGISCYIEGADPFAHPLCRAEARGIFGDPAPAEKLAARLAAETVFPVHLEDVLEDMGLI